MERDEDKYYCLWTLLDRGLLKCLVDRVLVLYLSLSIRIASRVCI